MAPSPMKNCWAKALAPLRDKVVIATKFGFDIDPGKDPRGMSGAPGLNSRPGAYPRSGGSVR